MQSFGCAELHLHLGRVHQLCLRTSLEVLGHLLDLLPDGLEGLVIRARYGLETILGLGVTIDVIDALLLIIGARPGRSQPWRRRTLMSSLHACTSASVKGFPCLRLLLQASPVAWPMTIRTASLPKCTTCLATLEALPANFCSWSPTFSREL